MSSDAPPSKQRPDRRGAHILWFAFLLGGCAYIPKSESDRTRVTLRGIITFTESGHPRFKDCHSKASIAVGGMTAGNYRYLKRRVGELSRRTRQPITAELRGSLGRTAKGLRLDRPALLSLSPGACVEEADPGLDYN